MSPDIPPALRSAIERMLVGVPRSELAARAAKISLAYRSGRPSAAVIADQSDAIAYALARLPATFAACARALHEAAARAPEFRPQVLLDAGCGPGGAAWAAQETWPSLATMHLLDSNPTFLAMSKALAEAAPAALRQATWIKSDLSHLERGPRADLVIASYALAEIPTATLNRAIAALWAACDGLLVLIEPGTPDGWRRILHARDQLLAVGGNLVAPCPHGHACPITAPGDWCHFSQRLARSRDHRLIKGAEVPFEDEKFTYLAVARPSVRLAPPAARIIARPSQSKPSIDLKLCSPDGSVQVETILKRSKEEFARIRRLGWGDQRG